MSSRSLRRVFAVLVFAVVLAPLAPTAGLHAAFAGTAQMAPEGDAGVIIDNNG
jgi:hypothetical protein